MRDDKVHKMFKNSIRTIVILDISLSPKDKLS